jgi:hypothetical protein
MEVVEAVAEVYIMPTKRGLLRLITRPKESN